MITGLRVGKKGYLILIVDLYVSCRCGFCQARLTVRNVNDDGRRVVRLAEMVAWSVLLAPTSQSPAGTSYRVVAGGDGSS